MKEFKLIEFAKEQKDKEHIEQTLSERSAEGWEVAGMTVDMSKDLRGIVVVLLQREKE